MAEPIPILTHERNMLFIREEPVQATRAGRVVYDTVIMIKVAVPGDSKSSMEYKAKVLYSEDAPHPLHGKTWRNDIIWPRFGQYVEKWETEGRATAVTGTPIEQWPMVNASQAALLKHHGVYNVESLPNLTDSQIGLLGMNARQLVKQAAEWLKSRESSAHAMELADRNRVLEDRLSSIEGSLKEQSEYFSAVEAALSEDEMNRVKAETTRRRAAKKAA